jgi:hypothetical protein
VQELGVKCKAKRATGAEYQIFGIDPIGQNVWHRRQTNFFSAAGHDVSRFFACVPPEQCDQHSSAIAVVMAVLAVLEAVVAVHPTQMSRSKPNVFGVVACVARCTCSCSSSINSSSSSSSSSSNGPVMGCVIEELVVVVRVQHLVVADEHVVVEKQVVSGEQLAICGRNDYEWHVDPGTQSVPKL